MADEISAMWAKDYDKALETVAPNGITVALGESSLDTVMQLCAELAASATILYHKCGILASLEAEDALPVGQFHQQRGGDFKQSLGGS